MQPDIIHNSKILTAIKHKLHHTDIRHYFALTLNKNEVEWLILKLEEIYKELDKYDTRRN